MRNATWDQQTYIQQHDPADGDKYVPLARLDNVSLSVDSSTRLTIDGVRCHVVRGAVGINTETRTVVTTITVVRDVS